MTSDLTVCDVNGLNGGLFHGFIHAGFTPTSRAGYLGLGRNIINANRSLFPGDWVDDITPTLGGEDDWRDWPVQRASRVVVAVPPCSGFSGMTGLGGAAGAGRPSVDHKSNACMWKTVRYASRHQPDVYLFESVTGAYKIGRPLMQMLRDELETLSGEPYTLTHWLHDGISFGAPTSRQRAMFVMCKGSVPFAAPRSEPVKQITTLADAIGDLEGLDLRVGDQPLKNVPGRSGQWAEQRRRADGMVDGHWVERSIWLTRTLNTLEMSERNGDPWPQGEAITTMMRRVWEAEGRDGMVQLMGGEAAADTVIRREFNFGAFAGGREAYDGACSLITGGGAISHVHPTEMRTLTYRELARVQGWPDSLRIDFDTEVYGTEDTKACWGKAVTPVVGRHAGDAVKEWLLDRDAGGDGTQMGQAHRGEVIGRREWLIDELPDSRHLRHASSKARSRRRLKYRERESQRVANAVLLERAEKRAREENPVAKVLRRITSSTENVVY
jgi:site-specific DNA-cytosine methylase